MCVFCFVLFFGFVFDFPCVLVVYILGFTVVQFMCLLFQRLSSHNDTYEFEQVKMNLKYPTHAESAFYANPSPQDHFLNPYDPSYSYMPPVLCDYCESPYHDASTCPYREYVDATCASFEKKLTDMTNQMIETMKLRFAKYSQ